MLVHPGALTLEVLEGRRARYVSPLRLYLAASVMFFLIAAVYALMAFRTVYREGWGWILIKSAAIAPLYGVALAFTMIASYLWVLLT